MGYRVITGFTEPVGSNGVLRQGSALPVFVIEGDYFRIYLMYVEWLSGAGEAESRKKRLPLG